MRQFRTVFAIIVVVAVALLALHRNSARAAITVQAPFNGSYTFFSVGSVPGVPTNYGGLTILPSNPNVLLIGGAANGTSGRIYAVNVVRDVNNHITGFSGSASLYSFGGNNDGTVLFGPGGVLFVTQYSNNAVGEIKPGVPNAAAYDKSVNVTPLGVGSSVGSLNFVPVGFPGAGQLKIWSYSTGGWYTAPYSPDGSGTFDIGNATLNLTQDVGPEGFIFIPPGSSVFAANSILVSEYDNNQVTTYTLDSNGNPNVASREVVIDGLTGAEGAAIDPLTGDFLFSTFGGANSVSELRGFAIPSTSTPTSTPTSVVTPTTTATLPPNVTATATATPTVTAVPTSTPTPFILTPVPTVRIPTGSGVLGGVVGAIGSEAEARANQAQATAVAAQVALAANAPRVAIAPPNTGTGGLRGRTEPRSIAEEVLPLLGLALVGLATAVAIKRRRNRV